MAAQRLLQLGDGKVVTSVIVAGEIRFGALRKDSPRLTAPSECGALFHRYPVSVTASRDYLRTYSGRTGAARANHRCQ
ncbi:hypothetical protein [Niveispirillum sp. KHB5.9]|uniref:hypothetical protein n=1 Tax=Niveispirillum sp. KHB5.9 TaxID=3400269 RepID=UPI003A863050